MEDSKKFLTISCVMLFIVLGGPIYLIGLLSDLLSLL